MGDLRVNMKEMTHHMCGLNAQCIGFDEYFVRSEPFHDRSRVNLLKFDAMMLPMVFQAAKNAADHYDTMEIWVGWGHVNKEICLETIFRSREINMGRVIRFF